MEPGVEPDASASFLDTRISHKPGLKGQFESQMVIDYN